MSDELRTTTADISVDETDAALVGVNAVMLALAETCHDGSGRERSIDLNAALLALSGAAHILFGAIPPDAREQEFDEWVSAVRRGMDRGIHGIAVRMPGGRA